MRFRQPLNELFRDRTQVKILRFLSRHPDILLTGRAVARHIRAPSSTVALALARLRGTGVVRSMHQGASILYQLNSQHTMARALQALFEAERDILRILVTELPLDLYTHARSVILYGSVARGEERSTSDVDLCFVARSQSDRKKLEAKMEGLYADFSLRTGNQFSPLILTASRFLEKYRKSDPLIRDIARDGKVLWGESISRLLSND